MKAPKDRSGRRGVTLVEVSTVVVLVGILAAVAVVGYIRYKRQARMAEATNMIVSIRSEQEAYKTESGLYANVSSNITSYYPASAPGPFTTQWGGPCGNCLQTDAWKKLNVRPNNPVMYGYATVSGVGEEIVTATPHGPPGVVAPIPGGGGGGHGSSSSSSGGSGNQCTDIAPTDPFYLVQAQGDTDGDGVSTTVLSFSCSNSIVITNEGE